MASSPSGIDLVEIRLPGDTPRSCSDDVLVVMDDTPWIDLGVNTQLSKDTIQKLRSRSGGVLDVCPDTPTSSLKWYRWLLWKEPKDRRRGEFTCDVREGVQLRVYVQMVRIFTEDQHQRMVEAIADVVRGATWDRPAIARGVRVSRRVQNTGIPELLENVREEIRLASNILRHPATELAPKHPDEEGMFGFPSLRINSWLPENRLVGWWARSRHLDLTRASTEIRKQRARRQRELDAGATVGQERVKRVMSSIVELEELLERSEKLLSTVWRMKTLEPVDWSAIGPAITRDSHRRRLLEAIRHLSETPQSRPTTLLSRFQERTTAALFELWGAIALVQTLQSLGWRLTQQPSVEWVDECSPERLTWDLTFGQDESLTVIFEPHADQQPLEPQPTEGPLLTRLQRSGVNLDTGGQPRFISAGVEASPDYILMLNAKDGIAFAIGEATASDLKWCQENKRLDWLGKKLRKLAQYSQDIGWWDPKGLTRSSSQASFLLLPGDDDNWLSYRDLFGNLDQLHCLVLAARPRDYPETPVSSRRLASIVETLRAHTRDGSTKSPLVPGRIVSESATQHM